MARLCYATEVQLAKLIRLSGLPDTAPPANAFRMFACAPALGAATLKLVFALLTETAPRPGLARTGYPARDPAMRLPVRLGPARSDCPWDRRSGCADRVARTRGSADWPLR